MNLKLSIVFIPNLHCPVIRGASELALTALIMVSVPLLIIFPLVILIFLQSLFKDILVSTTNGVYIVS